MSIISFERIGDKGKFIKKQLKSVNIKNKRIAEKAERIAKLKLPGPYQSSGL